MRPAGIAAMKFKKSGTPRREPHLQPAHRSAAAGKPRKDNKSKPWQEMAGSGPLSPWDIVATKKPKRESFAQEAGPMSPWHIVSDAGKKRNHELDPACTLRSKLSDRLIETLTAAAGL